MSSVATQDTGGGVSLTGWMWTWVTIGALVVVVVVGYLLGITSALNNIDSNLATVDEAVTGAGGDVTPLPDHIQNINGSLTSIDTALQPVPGQADQIIAALTSINGTLQRVDASLKDTSSSLVNTDGVLKTVLNTARTIQGVLVDAEDPPDRLGTENIHQRVSVANSVLTAAKGDTGNILSQLVQVNEHLDSVCRAIPTSGDCT